MPVMPIRAPEQFQRRNRHPFPGTQGFGQAHCVGVSKASGLFELCFTEFAIPETELLVLRDETDSSAAASP